MQRLEQWQTRGWWGEATGKPYAAQQNSGLGKFELLYLGLYNKI
jgi:hypothetical protein